MQPENQNQTPQTEFQNHEVNPPINKSRLTWTIILIIILLITGSVGLFFSLNFKNKIMQNPQTNMNSNNKDIVVLNLNDSSNTKGHQFELINPAFGKDSPRNWDYYDGNNMLTLEFSFGPTDDYNLSYFNENLSRAYFLTSNLISYSKGDFDLTLHLNNLINETTFSSFSNGVLKGNIQIDDWSLYRPGASYANRLPECQVMGTNYFKMPAYCKSDLQIPKNGIIINFEFKVQ